MANILIGDEVLTPVHALRSQGYLATHMIPTGSTSWNHTDYKDRSFISFSFGGRWIDDWGLVATIDGDRMQRAGSANFEDLVSTYDVLDGQFYWGTHFNANEISFILATDRITQEELDDFRHWFCAGRMAELILAEHPNRAIIARIAEPLNIAMLPFEEKTTITIMGKSYDVSTTIYKGEINIRFIMDDPFWYSKEQYIDVSYTDVNGNKVNSLNSGDALKIILEDGIPTKEMFTSNILIGDNNIYSNGEIVANNGIILNNDNFQYLYYPGNAPVEPSISFSLTPIINNDGYISSPKNSFTNIDTPYDKISFESYQKYELLYSLPGPYVGYNQAIRILNTVRTDISYIELRRLLRDNITNKDARSWALLVIDSIGNKDSSMLMTEEKLIQAKERMKMFLYNENSSTITSMNINIDCKTGRATSSGGYRSFTNNDITPSENDRDINRSLVYETEEPLDDKYTVGKDEDTADSIPERTLAHSGQMMPQDTHSFYYFGKPDENKVEDAGDILRSAYLKLKDKNKFTVEGKITPAPGVSYKIWTDAENGLKNFKVNYKYMYY